MPRRSSTGELVPKDISEILAREAKAHRGQRKQSGSLGQAFCWLKGSRKKKNGHGNGVNGGGTTAAAAAAAADAKEEGQNHAPGKGEWSGHIAPRHASSRFITITASDGDSPGTVLSALTDREDCNPRCRSERTEQTAWWDQCVASMCV